MDKYLVFALNKWVNQYVLPANSTTEGLIMSIYQEPVYEDKLIPCFELVKEFEINIAKGAVKIIAAEWASQYSLDNKVRTVVVKGAVFGD